MLGVGRRAIGADRRTRGIGAVERIVALGAQASERAEPDGVVVATVRLDVVGHGRRRDVAGLETEATERLDPELMAAAALPARGAVPAMDIRTVRHRRQISERGGERALKSLKLSMGVFGHHLLFNSLTEQVECAIYLPHHIEITEQSQMIGLARGRFHTASNFKVGQRPRPPWRSARGQAPR
jgi:hypothetical protein